MTRTYQNDMYFVVVVTGDGVRHSFFTDREETINFAGRMKEDGYAVSAVMTTVPPSVFDGIEFQSYGSAYADFYRSGTPALPVTDEDVTEAEAA